MTKNGDVSVLALSLHNRKSGCRKNVRNKIPMVAVADTDAMRNRHVADRVGSRADKPAASPIKAVGKQGRVVRRLAVGSPVESKPRVVAADRVAADRVAAVRVAADRVAADRVAADRVEADRVAADKVEAAGNLDSLNHTGSSRNPKPNRSAMQCKRAMSRCGRSAI